MPELSPQTLSEPAADRIARLEARLGRVEARLAALEHRSAETEVQPAAPPTEAEALRPWPERRREAEELEFEVGQTWFAGAGVLTVTAGLVFFLSLPHAGVPPAAPSLLGYGLVAGLFWLAHAWRRSFELVSCCLRASAMALLYFATLRLLFPAPRCVVAPDTVLAPVLLTLAVAANLAVAYRRKSPWLAGLALGLGGVTVLTIGSNLAVALGLPGLAILAVAAALAGRWPVLAVAAIPAGYGTYGVWAAGNPLRLGGLSAVEPAAAAPGVLLALAAVFAAADWLRRDRDPQDIPGNVGAALNCGLGYSVFLAHTAAEAGSAFAPAHAGASAVFLGLAVLFHRRGARPVSTFFYAMTGYLALSLAIVKWAPKPDVFVWLSLQSVVVVATAVWFRSRAIVVANFFIYIAIVLGYLLVAEGETGISIGFGAVALVTARILNWQRTRLELKTELMRNAYLACAFAVLPYALYHLVPGRAVSLAWIVLALFYYGLNLIVRNPKYRWMGHGTLALTIVYVVVVGTRQFEPVYRVLSYLAVGVALLIVSLSFTRARRRRSQP